MTNNGLKKVYWVGCTRVKICQKSFFGELPKIRKNNAGSREIAIIFYFIWFMIDGDFRTRMRSCKLF